jgi:hypothetical protein
MKKVYINGCTNNLANSTSEWTICRKEGKERTQYSTTTNKGEEACTGYEQALDID